MGAFMKEHDICIGSLLELFNVRFAPTPFSATAEFYGGIEEMKALQEEFDIFRPKRPFSEGAALLGLGGCGCCADVKNRWFRLLRNLPDDGDQKISDVLAANLGKKKPLPCYMQAHDSRPKGENRVKIVENDTPLFYLDEEYLTISLPMAPRPKPAAKKAKKKK
jgi:hypothetical protein